MDRGAATNLDGIENSQLEIGRGREHDLSSVGIRVEYHFQEDQMSSTHMDYTIFPL